MIEIVILEFSLLSLVCILISFSLMEYWNFFSRSNRAVIIRFSSFHLIYLVAVTELEEKNIEFSGDGWSCQKNKTKQNILLLNSYNFKINLRGALPISFLIKVNFNFHEVIHILQVLHDHI